MVHVLRSSWWVTILRGLTALGFALLILAHAHTAARAMSAVGDDVLGTYILADGVLCALVVVVMIRCQGHAPPLPFVAGAAGAGFGIYLLFSSPRVSSLGLTLVIGIWALAVGFLALDRGYVLYRTTPGPWVVLALGGGMRLRRRGAAKECGMLLAGAVALAFAVFVLALAATGTTIPLTIVGLFAAAFGYLQLRVGLTLGVLALAAADSMGGTGITVPGGGAAAPEPEGGMA